MRCDSPFPLRRIPAASTDQRCATADSCRASFFFVTFANEIIGPSNMAIWNSICRARPGCGATRPAHSEDGGMFSGVVFEEESLRKRCTSLERKTSMTDDPLAPRPVRDSQSEMAEIVLPNDANPLAALLGGRLMHWIDLAGAMAAHRHSRNYVVTASVDHIDFLVPVRVGDLVILRSSVNRVFHTSMEVGVKVFVENYIADTAQHVASAYLTFVAIDPAGNHLKVAAGDSRDRRATAPLR